MKLTLRSATFAIALLLPASAWAQGSLLLVGGGAEGADFDATSWSWQPYRWFVERARAGGPNAGSGRIAVIDVEPYPDCPAANVGYCAYLESAGATEAVALQVSRVCADPGCLDADDPATYDAIVAFDGVFFRGGDQSITARNWEGSELEEAVAAIFAAGGAVGGTSAGAMILSTVSSIGDATSYEATADPYHPRIELTGELFADSTALAPPTVLDSHLTSRARLGRLAVFLSRWMEDHGEDLLGIGIDQETALAVAPDGVATVYGEGAASFLRAAASAERQIVAGSPPYISDLELDQLTEGFAFDLTTRSVMTIAGNATSAGRPPPPPVYAPAVISGSAGAQVRKSDRWARWQSALDLYHGNLRLAAGSGVLEHGVVSTLLEDSSALREVRAGGPQWVLATALPHGLAVYLDGFAGAEFNRVRIGSDETIRVVPPKDDPEESILLLDCHGVEWVAQSVWDADGNGRPRQSVALTPCRLHLLNSQLGKQTYDVVLHAPG